MITLATLLQSTAQQVFNQVKNHLLEQNTKSIDADELEKYRIKETNLKCAAGCLISDSEYNSILEGLSWHGLIEKEYVPDIHGVLIQKLQEVHDFENVSDWEYELKKVAKEYNLLWE